MRTWLKLIGSGQKPITEPPFNGIYKEEHVGFRKAKKPGIRMGDHLFLYAPGGSKSIFALAEATGDPVCDIKYDPQVQGSCRWKLSVRYLINLPVASGVHINEVSTGQRNLTDSIQRASHIKLFPEECQLALSKLQKKTAT
jgi:hypothetical protein